MSQRSVIRAIEKPCEAMTDAAERITPYAPIPQAKRELEAWADAADGIVEAIDGARPNADSKQWRDDWVLSIKAVREYIDRLGTTGARLDLPPDIDPMIWASVETECSFPDIILVLDPERVIDTTVM